MRRQRIAVIGGGPAGMMAADVLARSNDVTIYEKGKTLGRKFLVAGKGGFNLTNVAEGAELMSKYAPAGSMDTALEAFGPNELRAWLAEMGIGTYAGTSGRVFPDEGIKPIEVLHRIRQRLVGRGVQFKMEHAFVGFDDRVRPIMLHGTDRLSIDADIFLFGLGGASWSVTGSKGDWTPHFEAIGIKMAPWQPSNCGVEVDWPSSLVRDHEGKALKNIRVSAGERSILGEATLTNYGLEGNVIYPIIPEIRHALAIGRPALLNIDLKPNNTETQLLDKLRGLEPKDFARSLNLDRSLKAMVRFCTTKEDHIIAERFVRSVKQLPVVVTGLRPIEEAISSAGGIRLDDLAPDLSLTNYPHLFVIGEMLDWDAPTGGYLLQGCFATGHHAAMAILGRS